MSNGKLLGMALLLCLGAAFLATPAHSHKGNERSEGCHTDRKTGEYHCHTPKAQPPQTEVTLNYCHFLYDRGNCGHTSAECAQLVRQHGGSCQTQVGFSAR